MKRTSVGVLILLIVSAILLVITGCGVNTMDKNIDKAGELKPVEIKEYQGEKLSSLNEFRENSIAGPQYVNMENYKLKVFGLVQNPKEYSYDDVINSFKSYSKLVKLDCVEGWSVKILWEGLLLKDLLAKANVSPNARVVVFHAYDDYTTSVPLDYILNKDIILAYKMNGVTIPPERGFPFHLVAESKWGYKWAKWVTAIELTDNVNYKGYWESRGYSNSADLDKDFFE
jgi:DMSO/TMAO reductase YedYZ molybdopterin-dependent catalytic subunit